MLAIALRVLITEVNINLLWLAMLSVLMGSYVCSDNMIATYNYHLMSHSEPKTVYRTNKADCSGKLTNLLLKYTMPPSSFYVSVPSTIILFIPVECLLSYPCQNTRSGSPKFKKFVTKSPMI